MKTLFASRTPVNSTLSSPWSVVVMPACMLLSGFAGLVYQICWAREFALVFGTTEVAVTLVLAAYLAGLGLGAWLIQRFLPFIERPALTYAVFEIVVAASAVLAVPAVIPASDWLLLRLSGNQSDPPGGASTRATAIYAIGAFAALAVPTVFMGATLPLVTRHLVETDRQTGRRVGALFAFNTAGAVAGALVCAYWLLPGLGLRRTVWSAAVANGAAALLALTVDRRMTRRRTGFSAAWAAAGRASFSRPPAPVWILPLMLLSGGVALYQELIWTRLLSHVLGSSLRAFAVMLGGFLGGLALGGAVGAILARDRRLALPAFTVSQLASALAAAVVYLLVNYRFSDSSRAAGEPLVAAGLLVPIAFFGGANFPLAVRILSRRADDAALAAARVYAWNTLGAILGALSAGFVLIPSLRFEGSIQLAVATGAALALASTFLLQRPARTLAFPVCAAAVATVAFFWPPIPSLLRASPLQINNAGRLLYYGAGRTASVVVIQQEGSLAFRTNGLPEALVEMKGSAPHLSGEKWMVPLALLTRPETQDMLVVGYGGGAVLEAVPEQVRRIDVIEIEPQVIEANRTTRLLRRSDPLSDPRVHVIVNDARAALNLTSRRYDGIVSQPSHPWTAAASHLYTREFLQQARTHLVDDGVFVQWMNVSFIDESLLKSFAATVLDVFPEVWLYRPDAFTLVFVASARVPPSHPLLPQAFPRFGINTPEDVFVALAADRQALQQISRGAPFITDDRNRMATATAYQPDRSLASATADRILAPVDLLQAVGRAKSSETASLRLGYVARRLALAAATDTSARARLNTLADAVDPLSASGYEINAVRLSLEGDADAAQDMLQQGLARYPDQENLRYQWIRPWLSRIARGTAPREVSALAAKLTRSADAVVRGTTLESQRRWSDLHALDDSLAEALWSDPWKLDAILLQTAWRLLEDAPADVRRHRAEEALVIIDDAIAAQPALILYATRLQSALAAHRSEAVVESAWEYGHGLFANAIDETGPAVDSTAARSQTQVALKELIRLLGVPSVAGQTRAHEVRDRLSNDLHQLTLRGGVEVSQQ